MRSLTITAVVLALLSTACTAQQSPVSNVRASAKVTDQRTEAYATVRMKSGETLIGNVAKDPDGKWATVTGPLGVMSRVLASDIVSITYPRQNAVPDTRTDEPAIKTIKVETISVLPWNLSKGTDGAKKTAKEFLATLLTKIKVDAVSEVKTTVAWEEVNNSEFDGQNANLPTAAQMLRVGNRLGVDWVMSGSAVWHSRSIWVSLGPKTKSTCTVNVRVVDVKNQTVALDVKNLSMDSTAKEDTLKALGTVFVSSLFTMVSGGPKTPHEQRAVQLGIAKALEPWLAEHLKSTKIDPAGK